MIMLNAGRPWVHVKTKVKKDYPSVQSAACANSD